MLFRFHCLQAEERMIFTRLSLHIALLKHLRHTSSPGGKGSEITVLCHIEDT